MKLRLTQGGFEGYTGQMGVVMFKDGLSEGDVLPIDGIRIAAAIGAEWEDGTAANVGEMYLNAMHMPAFVATPVEQCDQAPQEVKEAQTEVKQEQAAPCVYTFDELSGIADKEGIAGLRKIGDTVGVKGTSIVGIIDAILAKQGTPRVGAE